MMRRTAAGSVVKKLISSTASSSCCTPNTSTERFRRSLIFHYVPQSRVEMTKFYIPLLSPTGEEILVTQSTEGGVCGDGWVPAEPH